MLNPEQGSRGSGRVLENLGACDRYIGGKLLVVGGSLENPNIAYAAPTLDVNHPTMKSKLNGKPSSWWVPLNKERPCLVDASDHVT